MRLTGALSSVAPMNHAGSQVTWLRGGDADREAEVAEIVLPDVAVSPVPRCRLAARGPEQLPLGGNGNVVAACGVQLLEMVCAQ